MPELPEVETLRRDLERSILGRMATEIWIAPDVPRLVQGLAPEELRQRLIGARFQGVQRRGKLLIFLLSDGRGYLLLHRRMSGNLLHRRNGAPADPYTRFVLSLDDDSELRFVDLRKFGRLWLVDDPTEVTADLGPEPLEETFTIETLAEALRRRQAPIKAVLLDQTAIAGLGNLYADEALHLAGLHTRRPAAGLTLDELGRLHRGIREALAEGLHDRGSSLGTSLRDHINLDGSPGEHQHHVHAFRRTGQPCLRCGTAIERIKVGGRSTHLCPHCQPA